MMYAAAVYGFLMKHAELVRRQKSSTETTHNVVHVSPIFIIILAWYTVRKLTLAPEFVFDKLTFESSHLN